MARKRANGEGSWTERDNGTWKLSVSYKGIGRKYFYGTKQECLEKKRQYEVMLSSSITTSKDALFKDFAYSWLHNVKQHTLRQSTFDRLERELELHIIPNLGDLSIQQIDDYIIQTHVINKMKSDGYSFSTVKAEYCTLKQIFKYAIARGKITKNPLDDIELPSKALFAPTRKRKFLSGEDRQALITTCYSKYKNGRRVYKYGAFFVFLLYTGLRLGEASALKWKYIDFEKRTVEVSHTVVYVRNRKTGKGKMLVDQPFTKNGKSRTVYLSDAALEALEDLKEQMGYDPDGYIIHGPKGTIMHQSDIQAIFQLILKKAGIEKCGIHALRHSFVSLMINNGVPVPMISAMVGHSSIGITMNVYSHLLKETEVKSMEIIKELR